MTGEAPFGADPSFFQLVRAAGMAGATEPTASRGGADLPAGVPHGTTVLALRFSGGVVMAGDRRAVEGTAIADRRMDKVFHADAHSAEGMFGIPLPLIDVRTSSRNQ
jgi:hypothetical protein